MCRTNVYMHYLSIKKKQQKIQMEMPLISPLHYEKDFSLCQIFTNSLIEIGRSD